MLLKRLVDVAAVAAVLSEQDGFFTFTEEEKMALRAFVVGNDVSPV